MANIESVKLPNGSEYNIKDAISGYALQSEMSVTDGTGADADKTTIQLKSGTSATVLKTHQSISDKADKVTGGTNGNLASLDSSGNLTDAGVALNVSSPSNGQLMKYNGTSGKWENADAPASAPMPNLLLNPWFTVNQRGQNGVLATDAYGVDRWASGSGTATVKTGQFYGGSIYQRNSDFASLVGKTITLSAIVNGSVVSGTAVLNSNSFQNFYDDTHVTLSMDTRNSQPTVRIVVSSKNNADVITAVKLELGSQSTLALDTAPDYTTELLKCQRYFVRISANQGQGFLNGVVEAATTVRSIYNLRTQMRDTPTLSQYAGTLQVSDNGLHSVTSLSLGVSSKDIVLFYLVTTDSLTVTHATQCYAVGGSAYIDLSAEL